MTTFQSDSLAWWNEVETRDPVLAQELKRRYLKIQSQPSRAKLEQFFKRKELTIISHRFHLELLIPFEQLEKVDLGVSPFDENEFDLLFQLKSLKNLNYQAYADFSHPRVNLEVLSHHSKLMELSLCDVPLVDLKPVFRMKNLVHLSLTYTALGATQHSIFETPQDIESLWRLKKIRSLELTIPQLKIDFEVIASLVQLQKLSVRLSGSSHSYSLKPLESLSQLRELELYSGSEECLVNLAEIWNLNLDFLRVPVSTTQDEINAYQKAHPKCEIFRV